MRVYVPPYYKDFRCIGGACSYNCCIGWEIDIDEDTLARYEKMDGAMGKRIRESIDKSGDVCHFRLVSGERCPHLNDQNLCNIITECGEGALCEICREHPRYYVTLGELREVGVGLACPEGARLVLSNDDFSVERTEDAEGEATPCDENTLYVLKALRWKIFSMLQGMPLDLLIAFILDHSRYTVEYTAGDISCGARGRDEIDPEFFLPVSKSVYDDVAESDLSRTAEVYLSLDMLYEGFRDEMKRAFELAVFKRGFFKPSCFEFLDYLYGDGDRYYRRLLYYFLHRYMLEGAVDGEWDIRIRHAVLSAYLTVAIGYLRGGAKENVISAAIDYSQNIEYCEENLEKVIYSIDEDGYLPPLWVGQMFE